MAVYDQLIAENNLASEDIPASHFVLRAAHRLGDSKVLRFYIEGDGFGFKHPTEPSTNPTPVDPVSLKLALNNSSKSWVYLARPCQYTMSPAHRCTWQQWTTHVYSKEQLDSLSAAIDYYKKIYQPSRIELIGYSGGGVMALLLKEHRSDISKVTTVASNIDVLAWSNGHGQLILKDSLNPADYLKQLCGGEYHFIWGKNDTVVPRRFFDVFVRKLKKCAQVRESQVQASHYNIHEKLQLDIKPTKN